MKKPHLGILLKPTSHDCNMACPHCYYRSVGALYGDVERPRMSLEVLDNVCRQYRALEPSEIKIGWQGGEPTLMGLDFFRKAVEIEAQNARPGDCWGNSLQTNGIVLDDEWCEFLTRCHFLVGLSMDGPRELNTLRTFPNGQPTFDVVMRSLGLLRKHGCEFNILLVISRVNLDCPEKIFRFLVENDLHYSQFIPCTEPGSGAGRMTEHSITAQEYADFQIRLFDAWVENDDPTYYVRHLDNWLHLFFHLRPECCEYREDCSNLVTIEWNGDVYPCDFFVEARYRMGNVLDDTLDHMLRGRAWREFTSAAEQLPRTCDGCEWLWACNGGCYRHRQKLGIGPQEQPYLCEAHRRIFGHVFGKLGELKERPVKPNLHAFLNEVEQRIAREREAQAGQAGRERSAASQPERRMPTRNDPCPCGSGRKFKHCCMK